MYVSLKQDNAHNCCIHVANHLTIMKHWFLKKKKLNQFPNANNNAGYKFIYSLQQQIIHTNAFFPAFILVLAH